VKRVRIDSLLTERGAPAWHPAPEPLKAAAAKAAAGRQPREIGRIEHKQSIGLVLAQELSHALLALGNLGHAFGSWFLPFEAGMAKGNGISPRT